MAFLLHLQPSLKFPNSSHLIPTRPSSSRLSSPTNSSTQINSIDFSKWVTGFRSKSLNFALSTTLSLALSLTDFGLWKWVLHCLGKLMMSISNLYSIRQCLSGSYTEFKKNEPDFVGVGFAEGKVGVNKPELLPEDFSTVIDVAGFLSDGQEKRISQEIADIEKDTGFKLRVLAQNYPDTPGLAIKDYWQVDDRTIIFVADPTFGNIINFNVGASVDLDIPRSFWSRLAGKYGNIFYWKEKGEDASIEAAVMAISNCLREPVGRNNCSEVQ